MAKLLITDDDPPALKFFRAEGETDCEPVIMLCGGGEKHHCYVSLSGIGIVCVRTTCSPQLTVEGMVNDGAGTYCNNCDEEISTFNLDWTPQCGASATVESECIESSGYDPNYELQAYWAINKEVVDATTDKVIVSATLTWRETPSGALYGRSRHWKADLFTGLDKDTEYCKDLDGDHGLTWDSTDDYGPCRLTDQTNEIATVTAKFG